MLPKNDPLTPVDFLFIKAATIYPPIAYAYLSPHIENLGLKVSIIDLVVDDINESGLKKILIQKKPKYVGIKCLSFAADLSFNAAKAVKEALPECRVIFGGHHVTALPKETLSNPHIDFIVIGEGEITIGELISALEKNLPLDNIKGIGYKKQGQLIINEKRELIDTLDDLPLPAYHLLDIQKYFKFSVMHGMRVRSERFMPVFTSRGCPYNCIYCHHTEGYKFRTKSPERVFEEMKLLVEKYGIEEFHIEDDTFNVDIRRSKKIMDLVASLKQKVHLQFPNGLRADIMDEELAGKMKRAGTFLVCMAVETGVDRIMELIKKKLDLKKVKETVNILVKKRILTWGYFMLGFPTETIEEMNQTISFAKNLNLHFVSFSIVIPFPGTPLWGMIDTSQISYDQYFRGLNYSSPMLKVSVVPAEEMPAIKKRAVREFFTLWRMIRIASYITGFNDITYYWGKFLRRKVNY
ncbi:MAG: radical SAM protein [bacterium]